VDSLSGTNFIIGPQYLESTSSGVNVAFMDQDGVSLEEIFAVSTNVLFPILRALNPQLTIWHMKDVADIGSVSFCNRLAQLENLWRVCHINGDVVYLGTPYEYRDTQWNLSPTQNQLVRDSAIQNGRAYVDCMNPCVSYEAMVTNEFINADGVHPTFKCNDFLADVCWRQLGFFALRADRRLRVDKAGGDAVRISWPTVTGITYPLESSADFSAWQPLQAQAGDGSLQAYTNAALTNLYYRLRLEPP
jgi:hypothetical protein